MGEEGEPNRMVFCAVFYTPQLPGNVSQVLSPASHGQH